MAVLAGSRGGMRTVSAHLSPGADRIESIVTPVVRCVKIPPCARDNRKARDVDAACRSPGTCSAFNELTKRSVNNKSCTWTRICHDDGAGGANNDEGRSAAFGAFGAGLAAARERRQRAFAVRQSVPATPNSDMWTPSVDELLRARVITAVSHGSDFAVSGPGSDGIRGAWRRSSSTTGPLCERCGHGSRTLQSDH